MKTLILCPSLRIHGGVRVIVEWANHLARRGHDVTLFIATGGQEHWIGIDPKVSQQYGGHWSANSYDVVIATTPPLALDLASRKSSAARFYLLQMAEHLFQPGSSYARQAEQSYSVNIPIIGISRWVENLIVREYGRPAPIHYIGNGVGQEFRPGTKPEELTILVEGWESYNSAKDVDHIGPKVAKALKEKYGAKIVAFSQFPLSTMRDVPDEYHTAPSKEQLVNLYQEATFMIKASVYDARSCAPVEAMACGTVTARAIHQGDDDLYHGYNCLKCGYDYDALLEQAEQLITYPELRRKLEKNGLEYRKQWLSWDFWIDIVEEIIAEKVLAHE